MTSITTFSMNVIHPHTIIHWELLGDVRPQIITASTVSLMIVC